MRKVLFASPLFAAAAVKDTGSGEKGYVHTYEGHNKNAPPKQLIFRPSELPIYKPVHNSG